MERLKKTKFWIHVPVIIIPSSLTWKWDKVITCIVYGFWKPLCWPLSELNSNPVIQLRPNLIPVGSNFLLMWDLVLARWGTHLGAGSPWRAPLITRTVMIHCIIAHKECVTNAFGADLYDTITEPRTLMEFAPWWLERMHVFDFKILSAPFYPRVWHFPEYQPASRLWLIHGVDCAALITEKSPFFFPKWVSTGMWVQIGTDM